MLIFDKNISIRKHNYSDYCIMMVCQGEGQGLGQGHGLGQGWGTFRPSFNLISKLGKAM